jgi:enoyl-CoA hydratase/carnithine racemase
MRAHELGIVSEVVDPPERLRPRAQELAELIAQHDARRLAATKRALWHALEVGLTEARRRSLLEIA